MSVPTAGSYTYRLESSNGSGELTLEISVEEADDGLIVREDFDDGQRVFVYKWHEDGSVLLLSGSASLISFECTYDPPLLVMRDRVKPGDEFRSRSSCGDGSEELVTTVGKAREVTHLGRSIQTVSIHRERFTFGASGELEERSTVDSTVSVDFGVALWVAQTTTDERDFRFESKRSLTTRLG